ncbi:MAG TPA: serine/threonine-protein kinase [Polyangiaceae bacterium]|nr:serine/threonine-protein kinase [Polyangiaceae bacterium]
MTFPAEEAASARQVTPSRSQSRPSGVRLGSLPANSDQDLGFVQDRIGLFGKTTFLISTMFLTATTAADLFTHAKRYTPIARVSHILGTLLALGLWRLARRRKPLSPRTLQALDVIGTLGVCWTFAVMGHFTVQPYGFYTGLLAVTHVSITRAMIVPSVPQRTVGLAAASFMALVISRAVMPLLSEALLLGGSRQRGLLEAVLWSTAGCAVATVASTVIYGLHEIAREARQLGQYALEEKIGEGGMGEVYRASHAMLRRPTAVKLLSGDGSEHQLRRFEKEVQLTARLTHPNTISIYDYGRTPDGVFYYAMELLEGLTLEQLVERHGPQPPSRVIHLLRQVLGALREAHRIGLIHRDIKPANIYLCRRGDVPDFVKVLDFGLVREIKGGGDVTRSNVDAIVGTPRYLSPEAIVTPNQMDARADIYGLGGVAYFLVTGTPPFIGHSAVELCAHHLHTPPTPPSERHAVPGDLERVILSCLAKDPGARPQSAEELTRALDHCRDARGWSTAEAEAWWRELPAPSSPPPAPTAAPAPLPHQRAIFCDFERRFGDKAREKIPS